MENDENYTDNSWKVYIVGWIVIGFCCAFITGCWVRSEEKEVSLEAIKAGLHQDEKGNWVK